MRRTLARAALPASLIVLMLGLTACENMSNYEQRLLSGGAIGAAGGAALTAMTGGSILLGTAIGAAAGTAAGHVTAQNK
ncbi:MAG: hypothetical protein VYB54_01885 [Pseudomonadota bacterium]|nr:hypothetical protein [Pseudomonadota bacterium]